MKKLTKILCVIAVLIAVASCSKSTTGPQGPSGTNGTNGANGTDGTNGLNGNANVRYSDWFTPDTWKKDTIFGSYGFNYVKAEAALTQGILDSSVVIVYGRLNGYNPVIWPANQVSPLPIAITYMSGITSNIDTWSANLNPGAITIRLVSSTNAYSSISNAHSFRYVIITSSGHLKLSKPLQDMTYDEICAMYNIPK